MSLLAVAVFSCSSGDFKASGGGQEPQSQKNFQNGDAQPGQVSSSQLDPSVNDHGDMFGTGDLGEDSLLSGEANQKQLFVDNLTGEVLRVINFNMEIGNDGDFNDLSVCFSHDETIFKKSGNQIYATKDVTVQASVKQLFSGSRPYRIMVNQVAVVTENISKGKVQTHQLDLKVGDEVTVYFNNYALSSRGTFQDQGKTRGTRFESNCNNTGS